MHFQYAFLMAPRFSQNMRFSMGKCICLYIFWLAAENAYLSSIVQVNVSLNYAFLMVPRFFRNMHFFMGKCIFSPFGGFDLAPATNCGQRQLSMAGVQDAIASFWGIFMCC